MATTRIISMHKNRGKTIAQCLKDRTDYAINPDKTKQGELVSCYQCDLRSVDSEFLLSKREYHQITGRKQKSDVIAYQVRQSFRPGEISPEDANRIGYELAERFLKGEHAFIVATHIDKRHIHNHIIWNSTTLDCTRKFRDFLGSGRAVARLNDLICMEHRLSVVPEPRGYGQRYNKWLGDQATPSQRDELRSAIDRILAQNPTSFDALLKALQEVGWEVKRGKTVSLRKKGQARFKRLSSLGETYSEDSLRNISGTKDANRSGRSTTTGSKAGGRIDPLIDIQAKLQAGKGIGYERWAKVFNLKQMAQTLNYLTAQGVSSHEELSKKTENAVIHFHELSDGIKAVEQQLAEINELKTHVLNYIKTREVYAAYRQAGYSKRFAAEHQQEIQLHQASKKAFDILGIKKLPKVRDLQNQFGDQLQKKKALYEDYRKAKDEMRSMLTAKANVERILRISEEADRHEQKQTHTR